MLKLMWHDINLWRKLLKSDLKIKNIVNYT